MAGVNVGTAYLEIIPSAKGFSNKLQSEVGTGMAKAGKDAGEKTTKSFGTGLKSLVAIGAGAALGGSIVSFFKDANAEARESQKVGAITANVIKSTGGAANVTAKSVGNLATAISNKTGIDDEAVQSASNLLLTFTNLRNEAGKGNDVFNQATQAATDLGAAMGKEPKAAAIQLGKALNDPVKGITALSRVGVSFTEQQKKQIGTLVKSGHTLGAQKIILKELNKEFGGTAAAAATSGEKAAVAFGNLKEQVGTALLPVVDKVATVISTKIVPAISNFLTQMQSGQGAGGQFAAAIGRVRDVFVQVAPVIARVIGFLSNNKAAVGGFAAVILTVVAAIRVWAVAQAVLNVALTANPIGIVVVAIAALVAGLIYAYQHSTAFRNVVVSVFHAIQAVVGSVVGFVKSHLTLFAALFGPLGIAVLLVVRHFGSFKAAGLAAMHAVGAAGKWLWNNALQPAFKFIAKGVANLMNMWAHMLHALGHVPGFGWAKKAGDAMEVAARKANELANNINKIHDKSVTIATHYVQTGSARNKPLPDLPGRASGGPVSAGKTYLVGERGPELFTPPGNGRITPNHALSSAAMSATSSGGAATFHLYDSNGQLMGTMRGTARSEVNGSRAHDARLGRQSR